MARDVNGKELKVGDKVECITPNSTTPAYDLEVGVYTIKSVSFGQIELEGVSGLFYRAFRFKKVEDKGEPKLTPKLIESLDELQVGDCFKNRKGQVYYVMGNGDVDGEIETLDAFYSLAELKEMGAYKVKEEPLEMVEVEEAVEEVKLKIYELVEGEDYVKLERGDIVKFADGNTHGVHAVDADDSSYPYWMYFMGASWWVESHYFLPENIISINGVNIHEEVKEKDPYEGWVEGAEVRCIDDTLSNYEKGEVYELGVCRTEGNFGVLDECYFVMGEGHIRDGEEGTGYLYGTAYENFELIKG